MSRLVLTSFGLDGCVKLELVECIDNVCANVNQTKKFIANNRKQFTGVGKFEEKYTIKLQENSVPVARPPRCQFTSEKINAIKKSRTKLIIHRVKENQWFNYALF